MDIHTNYDKMHGESRSALVEMLNAAPGKRVKLGGYWYSYCLVKRTDGIEVAAICRTPIDGKIFYNSEIVCYTPEIRI